ncbi:ABC transporter permease [Flavihumibacter profundi]|uniref:ABC transporter permease n=1 Tax=Flavihumibacter profundi TaxID=2716883 RepID=UPI001CC4902A|nr:ABC transporter permease [Flavihumibacter profundi]MBZ5855830.1 ABC transporter permease [Flavihumibacter profundi]
MWKNYLIISFRNLTKNKSFSIINIAGLSIGMTATMLILLWVYNEYSWDKSYAKYDQVYHVMCNRNFNGQTTTGPDMMYPLPEAAKSAIPEIEHAAIASFGETTLLSHDDKRLNKNTITVSPEFLDIFNYEFIEGNAAAVKDPGAIILTESTAKALYGKTNIYNQPILINNGRTAFIKGVIKDVPQNSTLQFEAIIPFNTSSPQIKESENDWTNCGNRVFFSIRKGADIPKLESSILALVRARSKSDNPTTKGSIILHPMKKWRLYEEFRDGRNTGGRIQYVKLFTWIAIIILVIACVNFMNLSTARSEKRAKEIGIRKTLGSERKQLLSQFLVESLLLSIIAFLFAGLLVILIVPYFSTVLHETILIPYQKPFMWLGITSLVLVTGLMAGSYPAMYLSGFNPIKVLKGNAQPGKQALLPRKMLVTLQFIASIILITATLIIYQQLKYVMNREIGYDRDNLVMVNSSPDTDKHFSAFKNELLQSGAVAAVSRTSSPITTLLGYTSGIQWKGAPENGNLVIGFLFADEDFSKTLKAMMVEGRDFRNGDSAAVIFNKEAIKLMGIESPVGKTITWAGQERTIVGVIDNMIFTSPYEAASPIMVSYTKDWSGSTMIRLNKGTEIKKAISGIEDIYKKYSAAYPFEMKFSDKEFDLKFSNEKMIGSLSIVFSGLAIFVCCLGLFGLVSFSIEKRTKEIGIRKVLGASVRHLLIIMSKEFLVLVAIAFLVAIPISWMAMNKWLENFSYRTNINLGVFILVGILTLVITIITVSLNAAKTALSNPVKSLRSE